MTISHQDAIDTAAALGLPDIAQQLIRGDADLPSDIRIWFGEPPGEIFLMDDEALQEYGMEGLMPLWYGDLSDVVAYHRPSQQFVVLSFETGWDLDSLETYNWQQLLLDFFDNYWSAGKVSEERFYEVAEAFGFKHANKILEAPRPLDWDSWKQWKNQLRAELARDE